MDTAAIDNLKLVRKSNKEMLDYFNDLYIKKLEQVQGLKTQQFELKAKIDELSLTHDIYSVKSSSGHNVFSPFSVNVTGQQEKANLIANQIKDLTDVQSTLSDRIKNLEKEIDDLKLRISNLNAITDKLDEILDDESEKILASNEAENEDILEDEEDTSVNHGLNILRIQEYQNHKLSEKLNTLISEDLDNNLHKLEVISYLMKSDANRAKLTLDEVISSTGKLIDDVDTYATSLVNSINKNEPIWTILEDLMLDYKVNHPECVIESSIECPDYEVNISPIITSNFLYIIKEIMANAFTHSNANRIVVKIYISSRLIDVFINDNGVGIDSNFAINSPYYSGLHKIEEIIYLLNGNFKINGDIISGTNVRFSFPVSEE